MKYVVKSGDTLTKIAEEQYGDGNRWREIYEANKAQIENPNVIRAGWELDIPGVGEDEGEKKSKPDTGGAYDRKIVDSHSV
ncbi:MAG: LysM peptidoglycan-binding domain-containing protein [Anaerolineae bacterium]|nr:LysM peptidoglycan-binding domain-containing protein [Anaerolineae bacterium]